MKKTDEDGVPKWSPFLRITEWEPTLLLPDWRKSNETQSFYFLSKQPKDGIVSCRTVRLRERLLRKLLGLSQTVTILVPGDSVETVSIAEISERGDAHEAV